MQLVPLKPTDLIVFPTVVLFAATLFLARRSVLLAIGDFLVVPDQLQPADVIHVLSGPDERADYAIQSYQQGYGRQLIFTGRRCSFDRASHAGHARGRALEQGVPPEAIAIDGSRVSSTYSEAV